MRYNPSRMGYKGGYNIGTIRPENATKGYNMGTIYPGNHTNRYNWSRTGYKGGYNVATIQIQWVPEGVQCHYKHGTICPAGPTMPTI